MRMVEADTVEADTVAGEEMAAEEAETEGEEEEAKTNARPSRTHQQTHTIQQGLGV
jgi:hypothetical protein